MNKRASLAAALALLTLLTPVKNFATVYYADAGALNDGNLYVDIPTNMANIRGVYIVGKRGDMDTAFWGPRTNAWQPFLNSFGFVMGYRTQGEAQCAADRNVPQMTMQSMADVAALSGHPELAYAPVFIFGFSADSAGAAAMPEVYPERTLGSIWHSTADNCTYGSPESQTNELFYTPTMEISCANDIYGWQMVHCWTTMSNWTGGRVITGSVAWAHTQQGGGHGAYMDRTTLQFPWILSVLSQRLPTDTTPYTNYPVLTHLNTNLLWHGDQGPRGLFWDGSFWSNFDSNGASRTVGSFQIWAATNAPPSGLSTSPTWSALPDEAYARVWQTFCDLTNAAVYPSGNEAALAIQTVALMPMETKGVEESGKQLRFAVVRSRVSPGPLYVGFSLSGTASNGVDYAQVTNFTCTIPGGEWAGYIDLAPIDDTIAEGPESVTVTLTANTNSFWIHSAGSITAEISDDETSAPVVSALSPVNGEGSFIGTNLVMTFSRQMVKGSGAIVISNLTDHTAAEVLDVSSPRILIDGTTVLISLTNYLAGPKSYAVLMPSSTFNDTQDHKFTGMSSTSDWHFTAMQYDTTAPLLNSVWPTNNATMINRFDDINLTFNEAVMAGSGMITISNLTLGRNVEQIPVTDAARVFFNGSNVTIRPTNPLAQTNLFCMRIEPGVITDTFPPAPNSFAGLTNTTAWRFTTKADPGALVETFDTENATSDPLFNNNQYGSFGGVSNVQYSWYKIFSATGSSCQLIDGNGIVIESPNGGASQITTEFLPSLSAVSYQIRQAVLTSTPGYYNRTRIYAITRNGVTNQIKQFDYTASPNVVTFGTNSLSVNEPVRIQVVKTLDDLELTMDNFSWTPYSTTDTNAPVATFIPGSGSINHDPAQPFIIRFNEDFTAADGSPMSSSLAQAALYLTNMLTGAAVPFTAVFDYELGRPQITVTPDSTPDAFTTYELGLKPNTVRDLSGNTNATLQKALITTEPATRYFSETFRNEAASTNSTQSNWTSGSFVGDDGFQWNYVSAGSADYSAGLFKIDGDGLVLRSSANTSSVSAVDVAGGVGDLMVLFRNGSTTAGSRKIALDVSGQHYESAAVDSASPVLFRVNGINNPGNENTYNTIIISNASTSLVTIDSIVWTAYKDPIAFVVSSNAVPVAEGGNGSATVTLNQFPEIPVTAMVARVSGSTNAVPSPASFLLNENNWNTGISVSFASAEDSDVLNDSAVFSISAADVLSATVTVTQADNDTGPEVSTASTIVREGESTNFQVRLTKQPVATTTVTVSRVSGDTDLSVEGTSVFEFSTVNWSIWQTAAIAAASDADSLDGAAVFSVASTGVDPVLINVTEHDAAWVTVTSTNTLHVDFGLAGAPVETDGNFSAFTVPSSYSGKTTNMSYLLGSSNVTVQLSVGGSGFSGRDRGSPSADSGAMTYSDMYRDLIQATSSGNITMKVSGLRHQFGYGVRVWVYDSQYSSGSVFTNRDLTDGRNAFFGAVTNVVGTSPTNNEMYSVSGTVTSDASGTLTLVIYDPSATEKARVSGLELNEVLSQEIAPSNSTMSLAVFGATGGAVSPTGGVYDAGTVVQISATASSYWHFVTWTGSVESAVTPLDITVSSNMTVYAQFAENMQTNGTPQQWLAEHGLGTNDAAALSDTDGDGMAAWQEYIAGTLPNLGTSVFGISNHWKNSQGQILQWQAVSGRVYSVYWRSNLVSGVWSQMTGSAQGTYTDTVHNSAGGNFYQIKVQLAP